jgi:hypothetical protein
VKPKNLISKREYQRPKRKTQKMDYGICMICIGISNAIELWLNPEVHKEHNCPNIMHKKWEDYTYFDAWFSGVACCWPLIIPLVFRVKNTFFDINMLYILSVIATLLPAIVFLKGEENIYASHELLYKMFGYYFVLVTILTRPMIALICCAVWVAEIRLDFSIFCVNTIQNILIEINRN